MPNVKVYDTTGKAVGKMDLSEAVFGIEPHVPSMHLVVRSYLANQRLGTQSTKTRSEVRGGGKKPWRQKGSGRARHGSRRSPIWTGGGVALGPKPRSYSFAVNKKVRRLAIKSALSSKVRDDEFKVVKTLALEEIKTKEVAKILAALETGKKTLIVTKENDPVIVRSARNIEGVKVAYAGSLNTYEVLDCDTVLITQDAIAAIEALYAPAVKEMEAAA